MPGTDVDRNHQPNVLVFVTDDQRATGTFGVMPNVRKWFLNEGTSFTNAFATTPLCCPSRASIFSGRYAHNHGVRHNYQSHRLDQSTTMQRHLQQAGYATAIAGKYLNQWGTSRDPLYFDRWGIFLEGEYYDRQWNLDGSVKRLPDYTNDVIRAKSLAFLEAFENRSDEQPWFLYVGTNAAHAPFTPEPKYADAPVPVWTANPAVREKDVSDKPDFREIRGRTRSIRARQLRAFMSADDLAGDVMAWLDEHGELEDTFAVLLSDNGMQWGEHGFTGKRQPYTPSIRVPLVLRRPGRMEEGATDTRLAATIDVAPTVLDAAGIRPLPPTDGRSLLRDLDRKMLLIEHWTDNETTVADWAALRGDSFQYVRFRGAAASPADLYFDFAADPFQLHNLLADPDPDDGLSLKRLRRRLRSMQRCSGRSCW